MSNAYLRYSRGECQRPEDHQRLRLTLWHYEKISRTNGDLRTTRNLLRLVSCSTGGDIWYRSALAVPAAPLLRG
jgi:hypothetical protein